MERTVCAGDLYRHRRFDSLRPVWSLFDKLGDGRIAAVVFLGNPPVLWPALQALGICLRDWIVARLADAFLILSFYFGPYLAWAMLPADARLHLLLFAIGDDGEPCAGICAEARQQPRWPLWAFVATAFAGFAAMLPISAAFVGTSMETFNRLMNSRNWI
jgi:dolichyl-phosphate-mannose-protein mannosyltransferase